jgi:hypothetical protein
MYSFAAVKLFQLQKRASVGQRESYNKRDSEAEGRTTKNASKLPRSFSKVTSTLSRKRSKFNANKERCGLKNFTTLLSHATFFLSS